MSNLYSSHDKAEIASYSSSAFTHSSNGCNWLMDQTLSQDINLSIYYRSGGCFYSYKTTAQEINTMKLSTLLAILGAMIGLIAGIMFGLYASGSRTLDWAIGLMFICSIFMFMSEHVTMLGDYSLWKSKSNQSPSKNIAQTK